MSSACNPWAAAPSSFATITRHGPKSSLGDDQLNSLLTDHAAYKEKGDNGEYEVIWKREDTRAFPHRPGRESV
jgi:hypothetical protein